VIQNGYCSFTRWSMFGDFLRYHTHLLIAAQSSFLSIEVSGKNKPRLAKDYRLLYRSSDFLSSPVANSIMLKSLGRALLWAWLLPRNRTPQTQRRRQTMISGRQGEPRLFGSIGDGSAELRPTVRFDISSGGGR